MPLTIANWYYYLLSDQAIHKYGKEIRAFTHWLRIHTSGSDLPFQRVMWYQNGCCTIHNALACRTCERVLGPMSYKTTLPVAPPAAMSPIEDAWEHYRDMWSVEQHARRREHHGLGEEVPCNNPHGMQASRMASNEHRRQHRYDTDSYVATIPNTVQERAISVPVWSTSQISASPKIAPDELYIFPKTSQRVRLEDQCRGTVLYLRLPDMSVADAIDRLIVDHDRQDLWLGWYEGDHRCARLLTRTSRSILSEMKMGFAGSDGVRGLIQRDAGRWLSVRPRDGLDLRRQERPLGERLRVSLIEDISVHVS